jgi:hypothetical protein
VFERGQWWKNLANAVVPAASRGVKAYAEQAGLLQADAAGRQGDSGSEGNASPAGAGRAESVGQGEKAEDRPAGTAKGPAGEPLSQGERLEVAKLVQLDTKVKNHEMAHLAAAGPYARSGANFQYAKGPDGKRYAVAGEVSIDTARESTPAATISKMQTVRAAALAPADPSPQDRKVAASASVAITQASHELQMVRLEQAKSAMEVEEAGGAPVGSGPEEGPGAGDEGRQATSAQSFRPTRNQRAAAAIMAGLWRSAPQVKISA